VNLANNCNKTQKRLRHSCICACYVWKSVAYIHIYVQK